MANMVNTSDRTIRFEIGGAPGVPPTKFEVEPGATCEIPDGYCRVVNGRCVIGMIAPALKPAPKRAAPPPAVEMPEPPSQPEPVEEGDYFPKKKKTRKKSRGD